MRYASVLLATAGVCLSLGATVTRGARAQNEGEPFSLTDIDKDGRIDRKEYSSEWSRCFTSPIATRTAW